MNSLQGKKIGIWSLLLSMQFEIDQIVHYRPNIAVTIEGSHMTKNTASGKSCSLGGTTFSIMTLGLNLW